MDMVIDFNPNDVLQNRLAELMGLDKYKRIMEQAPKTDVSADKDFQQLFNGYYRIRRDETWRNAYYTYFEKAKNANPSFEDIITYLFEKSGGNVEASFSSKMLATINKEKPIWDQYVIQNLNLQLSGKTKEEKLKNAIHLYDEIEQWYAKFLESEKGKECVSTFNRFFPEYEWISDTKKMDTILWSLRK